MIFIVTFTSQNNNEKIAPFGQRKHAPPLWDSYGCTLRWGPLLLWCILDGMCSGYTLVMLHLQEEKVMVLSECPVCMEPQVVDSMNVISHDFYKIVTISGMSVLYPSTSTHVTPVYTVQVLLSTFCVLLNNTCKLLSKTSSCSRGTQVDTDIRDIIMHWQRRRRASNSKHLILLC